MRQPFKTNYAGAIYGTILSMAIIAGISVDSEVRPTLIAVWAAATAIVFWIAHVYSNLITRDEAYTGFSMNLLRQAMRHDWPMVQGSLIPAAALLLAPLGVVPDSAAAYVAVGVGVVVLLGAGLLVGHRRRLGWFRTLVTAGINASIGLVIVALKVFVH